MKRSFGQNLISFLTGCIIGLPMSLYAVNHQTPAQIPVCAEPFYTVQVQTEQPNTTTDSTTQAAEQGTEELDPDTLDLLACCVEAEAGNQGFFGKRLVVDVVLNRVDDPDYPDSIRDVIMQPYQFSVVLDGRIWQMKPTEETFLAIREELRQRTNNDIIFFTAEGFSVYGTAWQKVGDHYFSVKWGEQNGG